MLLWRCSGFGSISSLEDCGLMFVRIQKVSFPGMGPNQSKPNPSNVSVSSFAVCNRCFANPDNDLDWLCVFSRHPILASISLFGRVRRGAHLHHSLWELEKACLDVCVNPKMMLLQGSDPISPSRTPVVCLFPWLARAQMV